MEYYCRTTDRQEQKEEDEDFFMNAERDVNFKDYPKGVMEGLYVVQQYPPIPEDGFQMELLLNNEDINITLEGLKRADNQPNNMTLPVALMLLDSKSYPSLSSARKSCRKGNIVINRGPLFVNEETGQEEFNQDRCFIGRTFHRVYPGDIIGIQSRLRGGFYPGFQTERRPPFELPVVYEDDHIAVVNKPAGVVCYAPKGQGYSCMETIRAALPFVLKPPKRGTLSILRRPMSVHRLDKPTTGLLLIAKTKPALVELGRQFAQREVHKTYTAIVNGIPSKPKETSLSDDALQQMITNGSKMTKLSVLSEGARQIEITN